VRFTSDLLKGRARVFASVRAGSTKAATLRADALSLAGADALMMPVPPYATVPQGELLAVYRSVAEACALGLVVQDAPAMSGVELSIDVLQRIVDEVPNVLALKIETPASAAKISRLVELLDGAAPVFGGNGGLDFYRELERGASGTMPSAAYPDVFMRIWESFVSGNNDQSRTAHGDLLPLLTLSQRDLDTFLWTEKEISRRRGVIRSSRLRAPSQEVTPGLREELAAELERLIQLGLIGQPLGTV
jgi:4-hydroxy-tetrahydrodipicolinate synthase